MICTKPAFAALFAPSLIFAHVPRILASGEIQAKGTMIVAFSAESSVASLSLALTFVPALNYAFQQNAIPVLKELRFQNDGVALKDLVISVSTEPAFTEPAAMRQHGSATNRNLKP